MTWEVKMSRHKGLHKWIDTVTTHMPHLSKLQATVLALFSFGMVMVRSCGLTSVASFLANLLAKKENSVRQQLREWYYDAQDKKGEKRCGLDVTTCFGPLLMWILSWWPSKELRLALALDASTLGQRFTVLAISLLYRGCAIPVAWTVVSATAKGAWRGHWLTLLEHLLGSVPSDWTVIVLTDRGLYARWLYKQVKKMGWHPFFRINSNGKFRPEGSNMYRSLTQAAPRVGSSWCGYVRCFKNHPLECVLLARWDEGYDEPCLIITDLAPDQADACWYAMRSWIECGFNDTKSGGWQWQKTRITDPDRAMRFWLAIAVATLWAVSVGGEADATLPASSFDELPPSHIARRRSRKLLPPRLLSCFRRGVLKILSELLAGRPLPLGRFHPEPWPCSPPLPP